ncbi:hypothetical protein CbuRSA425_08715 [Coxiella burnetii]|nr:hypothetical protein B7L74_08810 [Coxiella burnetii]OYK83740.1 hypothetical protein CbuRSA315_08710 [Coxiella burnetii]OYK87556.1 hypothetical protein CbuRSA345_08710 [Coxiella burnetii]OYK90104.1 hypothetical protein CbuRSA338_08730 [Coxiella burnetii]OYK93902.1 hypothetical protein CbuRSA270_08725 [Coxiella burnetii]
MTKSAPNWIPRTSRGTTAGGLIDARPSECEILPVPRRTRYCIKISVSLAIGYQRKSNSRAALTSSSRLMSCW